MSLARRAELLGWATQAGAWVVEDDYDGEYHYAGPPLPALKSLDAYDRVIYTGSFSKVLYPGLALAYLVAPAPLVQACGQATRPGQWLPKLVRPSSPISWPKGIFSSSQEDAPAVRPPPASAGGGATAGVRRRREIGLAQGGGMHLIVRLPEYGDDAAQARRAQAAGLNASPCRRAMQGKRRGRDCCWDSRIWPPRMRHYACTAAKTRA